MRKNGILDKHTILNDKLVSWKDIEGEIIFLHHKERQLYELTKTAGFIWREAVAKKKIGQIIEAMLRRYKKEKKEILKKDTLDFINDFVKRKIFLLKK